MAICRLQIWYAKIWADYRSCLPFSHTFTIKHHHLIICSFSDSAHSTKFTIPYSYRSVSSSASPRPAHSTHSATSDCSRNMAYYQAPSNCSLKLNAFQVHVPDAALKELRQLIEVARIPPTCYENTQQDRRFGVTHKWITETRDYWLNTYDW